MGICTVYCTICVQGSLCTPPFTFSLWLTFLHLPSLHPSFPLLFHVQLSLHLAQLLSAVKGKKEMKKKEGERKKDEKKSRMTFHSTLHYWLPLIRTEEITEIQLSPSLSLSPSLPLTHQYTVINSDTHTTIQAHPCPITHFMHKYTHLRTVLFLIHIHTHEQTHKHWHKYTFMHPSTNVQHYTVLMPERQTDTHTHTHTRTHTHARMHTHTHTHTHAHTHTHTRTHTHLPCVSPHSSPHLWPICHTPSPCYCLHTRAIIPAPPP